MATPTCGRSGAGEEHLVDGLVRTQAEVGRAPLPSSHAIVTERPRVMERRREPVCTSPTREDVLALITAMTCALLASAGTRTVTNCQLFAPQRARSSR